MHEEVPTRPGITGPALSADTLTLETDVLVLG